MKTLNIAIASAVFLLVFTEYRSGDLNFDGRVTITDLVIMRQMVEGLTQPSLSADLNYDGLVNQTDLSILRYKLAN